MDFNLAEELQEATRDFIGKQEQAQAARGRLEYLQSLWVRFQEANKAAEETAPSEMVTDQLVN